MEAAFQTERGKFASFSGIIKNKGSSGEPSEEISKDEDEKKNEEEKKKENERKKKEEEKKKADAEKAKMKAMPKIIVNTLDSYISHTYIYLFGPALILFLCNYGILGLHFMDARAKHFIPEHFKLIMFW